jgi:hypothetical protein
MYNEVKFEIVYYNKFGVMPIYANNEHIIEVIKGIEEIQKYYNSKKYLQVLLNFFKIVMIKERYGYIISTMNGSIDKDFEISKINFYIQNIDSEIIKLNKSINENKNIYRETIEKLNTITDDRLLLIKDKIKLIKNVVHLKYDFRFYNVTEKTYYKNLDRLYIQQQNNKNTLDEFKKKEDELIINITDIILRIQSEKRKMKICGQKILCLQQFNE